MSKEPVAPTFLHKPILRQEDDGNRLVFECELIANPRPTVSSQVPADLNDISVASRQVMDIF